MTNFEHVYLAQSTTLDECLVVNEPLGVVFIMGTWCSPVQMCLVPLVGAIAAGTVHLPLTHLSVAYLTNTPDLFIVQVIVPSSVLLCAWPTQQHFSNVSSLPTWTM